MTTILNSIAQKLVTVAATCLTIGVLSSSLGYAGETCFNTYEVEGPLFTIDALGSPDDGINHIENVWDWDNLSHYSTNTPSMLWGVMRKYIILALAETHVITGIEIDWYKGNERTNDFEVFGYPPDGHGDLVSLFKGTSQKVSGMQYFPLKPYLTNGVYIVHYKNSSPRKATSQWFSVTETRLYGFYVDASPIAFR